MTKNKDEKKLTGLETAIANIKKTFGKDSISINEPFSDVEFVSSGSIGLDRALGGGYAKGRIIEIMGQESTGKAQPLTSNVLTPTGWKKMGDIQVGDIICSPDGTNTTVIATFPQGEKEIYKIQLDDKTSTLCTADHLWLVQTRESDLSEVLTTQQLIDKGLERKNKCRKFRIPISHPLIFNKNTVLPINPWLLGFLLGDGSFRGVTPIFTTADSENIKRVHQILKKDFPEMYIGKKRGKCTYSIRNKFRNHKKSKLYDLLCEFNLQGKLSQEKTIPEIYLFASISQRVALLQGLMDSDGMVDQNGGISFSTSSPILSKQFEFLTRSLGFRCSTSQYLTKYKSETGNYIDCLPAFRSNIMNCADIKPVLLNRKASRLKDNMSNFRYRYIESIEIFGKAECKCIEVGHPNGLYITDDFIVTHNSSMCLHLIAEVQKNGGTAAYLDVENALDAQYAEALGVNMNDLVISQPEAAEVALDIAEILIRSGEVDVLVLDSVAALVPRVELEGKFEDQQMGLQARIMSKAMRKLVAITKQNNTIFVLTNQYRSKIGPMGGKTTTGGNALKYAASQRIELEPNFKNRLVVRNDITVATNITAKVIKNKVAPPLKRAALTVVFGRGICPYTEIITLAIQQGILNKSGAWIKRDGEVFSQGFDNAVEKVKEDEDLFNELKQLILGKEKTDGLGENSD